MFQMPPSPGYSRAGLHRLAHRCVSRAKRTAVAGSSCAPCTRATTEKLNVSCVHAYRNTCRLPSENIHYVEAATSTMPCFFNRYGSTINSMTPRSPIKSSGQFPKIIAWQSLPPPLVRVDGTWLETYRDNRSGRQTPRESLISAKRARRCCWRIAEFCAICRASLGWLEASFPPPQRLRWRVLFQGQRLCRKSVHVSRGKHAGLHAWF
jgi:hypothetical protein